MNTKRRVMHKSGYHAEWDMKPRYRPEYADESLTLNDLKERHLGLINLADYVNFDDGQRFPNITTIDAERYPTQEEAYIGASFYLRFQDEGFLHEIETAWFKCVRFDTEEPYRIILVNDSRKLMIVTNNQDYVLPDKSGLTDEKGTTITNQHVHQIPIQHKELLGVYVRDGYLGKQQTVGGRIVRADEGGDWPQYVILEFINKDEYRLVTIEETKAVCIIHDICVDEDREYWPDDWLNLGVENDTVL